MNDPLRPSRIPTIFLTAFSTMYVLVWIFMIYLYFLAPIDDYFYRLYYASDVKGFYDVAISVLRFAYILCYVPRFRDHKLGLRFWYPILIMTAASIFLTYMDKNVLDNQCVLKFYYGQ